MNKSIPYNFFEPLVLRTPTLSYEEVLNTTSFEKLKAFVGKAAFLDPLFLASPDLYHRTINWLKGEVKDKKELERLPIALMRYYLRMIARPTPFGLFAGCSVGAWGDTTNIVFPEINRYERHTRLDMHYLCALAEQLSEQSFIKSSIKFYPNTGIYENLDQLRYIEYQYEGKNRKHNIVGVQNSEYLQTILAKAKNGAKIEELAYTLVDNEIAIEEAKAFVEEVIASKLLISELEPAVTGPEFIDQILHVIENLSIEDTDGILNRTIRLLKELRVAILALDKKGVGVDVADYKAIISKLDELNVPYELNRLFQTDMIKPALACELDKSVAHAIKKGVTFLNKITFTPPKTKLDAFREAFYEKYEDKEVPLLDALDTEFGVGFTQHIDAGDLAPLVDDLQLPSAGGSTDIKWGDWDSILFKKYQTALQQNQYEIALNDKDVDSFDANWEDIPDTLSVMFKLTDRGNDKKIYLGSVGGSSAANLLGRFCHTDEKIHDFVKNIIEEEEQLNPDVIYAEIIHLPESRIGNILLRPVLRDYEIPYLAKSAVDQEHQIRVEDLLVSVQHNRIRLRSKKLQKEIIPRLTTAHNYSMSELPVYEFLCNVQTQNQRGSLVFNWGRLFSESRFLPRITYSNLILSLATWHLTKEDYKSLLEANEEDQITAICEWRKTLNMPRYVAIADGDNELFIDFENDPCITVFIHEIRKRAQIQIIEFLFDPEKADSSIAKNIRNKSFVNQFIVALKRDQPVIRVPRVPKDEEKQVTQRTFSLGDEWLYYKLYTGSKTADKILTENLKPLLQELTQKKIIDHWFFIRYTDPKSHLRIRFHLTSTEGTIVGNAIELIAQYLQPVVNRGVIWKMQVDTYQRELERYGTTTMELSEQLFWIDSESTLSFIDCIEGDEGESIRWIFAIRSIDQLLTDFHYILEAKLNLMERLKTAFAKEFNTNKALKSQLSKKYRAQRTKISDILDYSKDRENEIFPVIELLYGRSKRMESLVPQILQLQTGPNAELPLNDLVASYIHMLLNRLFKSKQRIHEMVIYDFLFRDYQSQWARLKKK